jgi:hypothetical protein
VSDTGAGFIHVLTHTVSLYSCNFIVPLKYPNASTVVVSNPTSPHTITNIILLGESVIGIRTEGG